MQTNAHTTETASSQAQEPNSSQPPDAPDEATLRRLGIRPIRLRTVRPKLSAEKAKERRHIGHGQLFVTGEMAMQAILQIDADIEELRDQVPAGDPRKFLELMRLKMSFNRQLLEAGIAHLKAVDEPGGAVPPA